MSTKIVVSPLLQENYNVPDVLEVSGRTVGECLDDLVRQYPESRSWLLDADGLLRILISINNIETVTLDKHGLEKALNANDELQIIAMISGG